MRLSLRVIICSVLVVLCACAPGRHADPEPEGGWPTHRAASSPAITPVPQGVKDAEAAVYSYLTFALDMFEHPLNWNTTAAKEHAIGAKFDSLTEAVSSEQTLHRAMRGTRPSMPKLTLLSAYPSNDPTLVSFSDCTGTPSDWVAYDTQTGQTLPPVATPSGTAPPPYTRTWKLEKHLGKWYVSTTSSTTTTTCTP